MSTENQYLICAQLALKAVCSISPQVPQMLLCKQGCVTAAKNTQNENQVHEHMT